MLWTVWPLDKERNEILRWDGLPEPSVTISDRRGINTLSDYQVTIVEDEGLGGAWQALAEHHQGDKAPRTRLHITEYTGGHEPQHLWFDHGSEPLIEQILKN
jgi:hypothetical protein